MARFLVCCAALVFLASPAFAGDQDPSANSSTQSVSAPPADFLLGSPIVSIGFRGSWFKAGANSYLFDFVTEQLSVDKSDFNTGAFGFELGVNVASRVELVGSIDWNGINQPSDYRLLEDNRGLPIQQTTGLEQFNLTMSGKFLLIPRGRSVSRLAWIPNTFVPYVGAGAGYGNYDFQQTGDFVDYEDNHVFSDAFRSSGWAPIVHVLGGTDIRVYKHLVMSFEGKYSWSHADLSQDFVDFEPIDLGGFRFGAGLHFTF